MTSNSKVLSTREQAARASMKRKEMVGEQEREQLYGARAYICVPLCARTMH